MKNTIPVPTKPEDLDALPEYEGPDAIGVYSFDDQAVFWTDARGGRLVEQGPAAAVFGAASDPIAAAYLRGERPMLA